MALGLAGVVHQLVCQLWVHDVRVVVREDLGVARREALLVDVAHEDLDVARLEVHQRHVAERPTLEGRQHQGQVVLDEPDLAKSRAVLAPGLQGVQCAHDDLEQVLECCRRHREVP